MWTLIPAASRIWLRLRFLRLTRCCAIYPEFDHLDAITAADQFAANPHAARDLVMRAQQQAFSSRAAAPF